MKMKIISVILCLLSILLPISCQASGIPITWTLDCSQPTFPNWYELTDSHYKDNILRLTQRYFVYTANPEGWFDSWKFDVKMESATNYPQEERVLEYDTTLYGLEYNFGVPRTLGIRVELIKQYNSYTYKIYNIVDSNIVYWFTTTGQQDIHIEYKFKLFNGKFGTRITVNGIFSDFGNMYLYDPIHSLHYHDTPTVSGQIIEGWRTNEYYSKKQFTLTVSNNGFPYMGTTNPPIGIHSFDAGITLGVTAYPTENYYLYGWLLDGINVPPNNPIQIFMNKDHTISPQWLRKGQTPDFGDPIIETP